jgi:polyhydroxybutyrate depolymerase
MKKFLFRTASKNIKLIKAYTLFCIAFVLVFIGLQPLKAQTTGSFMFEGTERTYTLYVPTYHTNQDSFPLLFALHGLTQTGNEMMQFSNFNLLAQQDSFLVVYPDGLNFTWNVGFAGGANTNDVGFLSALIDSLHSQYNIDLNRVYSTGFSNGGFMSYRLACELNNRIAAIASVAGTMTDASWTACEPGRAFPIMHMHGTNDLVVSYNGGFGNKGVDEVLTLWRTNDACPANATITNLPDLVPEGSTVQTHSWFPCNDSTEVLLYKIINGGHSWPGSVGTTGLGNTNRDISASQEIWNFVKRFALASSVSIAENPAEAIKFPNPIKGIAQLRLPLSTLASRVCLYSVQGKLLKLYDLQPGTTSLSIDATTLITGIYIVKVEIGKVVHTAKLVVL